MKAVCNKIVVNPLPVTYHTFIVALKKRQSNRKIPFSTARKKDMLNLCKVNNRETSAKSWDVFLMSLPLTTLNILRQLMNC